MAKNYTIDDKMRADDGGERSRGRERYGGGATTSFQVWFHTKYVLAIKKVSNLVVFLFSRRRSKGGSPT